MRVIFAAISSWVIIGGFVAGCAREESSPQPVSVVLITVDTLRSDRIGAYGYAEASTPAIDELAAEGTLFENVYCDVSWTTASVATILTGLFSTEHGLQAPWLRLPDTQLTVAEVFRNSGYSTGAVVGIFTLDSAYGLDQGFDYYDDDFSLPTIVLADRAPTTHVGLKITDDLQEYARLTNEKLNNDAYKLDGDVSDSALAWLADNKNQPFFLWVHYFGPHERLLFGKNVEANRSRIIRDYDLDLAKTDIAIGRLLKGIDDLGLRDRTLVVLSSDHGQSLGERGPVGHGRALLEPEVRIPLVVRLPSLASDRPGIPAGLRVSQVVRTVDIFPTLLDYSDIPRPDHLVGRSVRDLIDGKDLTDRLALMDLSVIMPTLMDDDDGNHFFGAIHLQAIRIGQWKLIKGNLSPSCWAGGGKIVWGIVGLAPTGRNGATRLPDDQCVDHGFTSLFDVSQEGPALASEKNDMASSHPDLVESMKAALAELASRKGQADSFELTPEQEQKLKSLGYLR